MSIKCDFNPNDHADGTVPGFRGGLYIENPDQGVSQQVQQDAGSVQQQVGAGGKSVVKQGGVSPRPETVGGDFDEYDWSPL